VAPYRGRAACNAHPAARYRVTLGRGLRTVRECEPNSSQTLHHSKPEGGLTNRARGRVSSRSRGGGRRVSRALTVVAEHEKAHDLAVRPSHHLRTAAGRLSLTCARSIDGRRCRQVRRSTPGAGDRGASRGQSDDRVPMGNGPRGACSLRCTGRASVFACSQRTSHGRRGRDGDVALSSCASRS